MLAALITPARAAPTQDTLSATLDNGLRVVIVRSTLAPVVTTEINYRVGSDEAPPGFPGTAHALEHMMFRGSPGLDKDQLAAIAAQMGGSFSADTTQGVTQYFFNTPAQDLDVALRIEALRMQALDLSDEGWSHERGAIEQEVARDLSSPEYRSYEKMHALLFAGTPYAHTPLGTKASFERTRAAMLRDFHRRWYAPNNAILVVTGDIDPSATLVKVRAAFADIPRRPLPARPRFEFRAVAATTLSMPTDSGYGTLQIAWRFPGLASPDAATARVLARALASQRAALYELGMNGSALFGGFALDEMPQASIGMATALFARGADRQPLVRRVRAILTRAAQQGIDPELVEAAKRQEIADLEFHKNSVGGLANAWSQASHSKASTRRRRSAPRSKR